MRKYAIFLSAIIGMFSSISAAHARLLPFDPPSDSFEDVSYFNGMEDGTFQERTKLIIYFGRNVENFLNYYDKCSINGFEKSKGGFLGMDIFGDYKETREGVKSIAPKSVFSSKLIESSKSLFTEVEYASDGIDAYSKAEGDPSAVIAVIDLWPAKGCDAGSGGSYGPYDVWGAAYVYSVHRSEKCFNRVKMKGSKIFKAGGGKSSFFDVDFSKLPEWMVGGYAALSVEQLIAPCLS